MQNNTEIVSINIRSHDDNDYLWNEMSQRDKYTKIRCMPHINDLDRFYMNVYEYFNNKGIVCIVTKNIVDLFILGFTIMFSSFILFYFDWNELMKCNSEATCHHVSHYVRTPSYTSTYAILTAMYFLTLSVFWCWKLMHFVHDVPQYYNTYHFVKHVIKIPTNSLETIKWDTIVQKIITINKEQQFQYSNPVDAKDIACRIMRVENYIISMFEHGIIPTNMCCGDTHFTKHVEWLFRIALFNKLFKNNYTVDKNIFEDSSSVVFNFKLIAFLNFIFMPFIVLFMIIHFCFKNVENFHQSKDTLGLRDWSNVAKWKFRKYNELPHVFNLRMNRSYEVTNDYIKQFNYSLKIILAKGMSFVAGSFLGLFLLFGLLDENIPLYVVFLGRNLFWYIAILSGIIAGCRTFIPERKYTIFNPDASMEKIIQFTNYQIEGDCRSYKEMNRLLSFYPFKIMLLWYEIVSVVMTPYLFGFVFAKHIDKIITFIRQQTVHIDGLGDVCKSSQFNDCNTGSNTDSNTDKIKTSIVSFRREHLSWTTD